jgi:EAL domain-containing protein (putative c-di-GMP-specific phosphodiesterase class I)
MPMLLEVHEDALADVSVMRRLRDELNRLDIQLGYDDFGSGTARLHELAEVPPDVLKFDQKLIQGIDKASPHRQAMVRRLVSLVNDLGITSLAEGVETAEEAGFCRQAGFAFAQGFFFGKPASIEQLQAASRTDALQEAGR